MRAVNDELAQLYTSINKIDMFASEAFEKEAKHRGITSEQYNDPEAVVLKNSIKAGLQKGGWQGFEGTLYHVPEDVLREYEKAKAQADRLREYAGVLVSSEATSKKTSTGRNEGSNSSANVSGLTSSGSKPTNVYITFRNLIEHLQMYNQTFPESVSQVENELIEGLLRVVNSANRISER
jgi:hypothetical protein